MMETQISHLCNIGNKGNIGKRITLTRMGRHSTSVEPYAVPLIFAGHRATLQVHKP